jgi:hypothetical protein
MYSEKVSLEEMEMEIQTVMKKIRREEDLPPQFSSTELLVIL